MNDATSTPSIGDKQSTLVDLVDQVCDQFEKQWRSGTVKPRIEDFIEPLPANAQGRVLEELLAVEVSLLRRDETPLVPEEYQRRFPAHLEAVLLAFRRGAVPNPEVPAHPRFARSDELPEIPGYELLGELARGGMGVVYRARQLGVNRLVALKMILAGEFAGLEERVRFQAEAEAAGRLDHPGIVPIFEVGDYRGNPYFSMAYVEGQSLAKRLEQPLTARTAAELTLQIAEAIAYAHSRGIIHRDLKPGNVLLDSAGRVKITDFGLAKRLNVDAADTPSPDTPVVESHTATGMVLGTPSYMPPEQAAGKLDEVDARSDVYAVGAVLYALLTGRPPHKGASLAETLQLVLNHEPVSPRQLQPSVPRDLETICLKCLSKEPVRRYATAAELADDVRRWLEGKPIVARPAGRAERLWRWCRRQPIVAGLIAATAVSLVAGVTVSLSLAFRAFEGERQAKSNASIADRNAEVANTNAEIAKQNETRANNSAADAKASAEIARTREQEALDVAYASRSVLMQREWERSNVFQVGNLLELQKPRGKDEIDRRGWEWRYMSRLRESTLRSFSLQKGSLLMVNGMAVSPDGTQLVTAVSIAGGLSTAKEGAGGWLKIYNLADGRLVKDVQVDKHSVQSIAFSPTGDRLAVAGGDASFDEVHAGFLTLWDPKTWTQVDSLRGISQVVTCVAFHPEGKQIASGSRDKTVRLWDVSTGKPVFTVQAGPPGPGASQVEDVAFSLDGKRLAAVGAGVPLTTWDLTAPGSPPRVLGDVPDGQAVAFSADGMLLACAVQGAVTIRDVVTGNELKTLRGHTDLVERLAFLRDGRLISASRDETLRSWDPIRGVELRTLRGHVGMVRDFTFDAQGWQLISADDGQVLFWDPRTDVDLRIFPSRNPFLKRNVQFSPDGKLLAYAHAEGIAFLNRQTLDVRHVPRLHPLLITGFGLSRDGLRLATAGLDSKTQLIDVASGKSQGFIMQEPPGDCLAVSSDGRYVAVVQLQGQTNLLDGKTMKVLHPLPESAVVAFHPQEDLLLVGTKEGVQVVDPATGKKLRTLGKPGFIHTLSFLSGAGIKLPTSASTTGSAVNGDATGGRSLVATGGWANDKVSVKLIDWKTGEEVWAYQGLDAGFNFGLAVSPDARRVFVGVGNHVRVIDVTSKLEVLSIKEEQKVWDVALDPDGDVLAVLTDHAVKLYDARPLNPELRIEREAFGLVNFLIGQPLRKTAVIEALKNDARLNSSVRERALGFAAIVQDNPERFNQAAWLIAVQPGLARERYAQALNHAQIANELAPNNGQLLNTLGACQYRMEDFPAAAKTLEQSEKLNRKSTGLLSTVSEPTDLALLAMTQEKLGQHDAAVKRLAQAKKSLAHPLFSANADGRKLVAEAERVVGK